MEVIDAVEKVHKKKELDEKLKGMVLCSALSFIEDWKVDSWELNFYDRGANRITQVTVDGNPRVKTEGEPFKDSVVSEIDMAKVKVRASEALETGKEYYEKNYGSVQVQKIFFALHGGGKPYWAISVITKHLTIVMINVDSSSGKIIKSKVHMLFDKKKNAS